MIFLLTNTLERLKKISYKSDDKSSLADSVHYLRKKEKKIKKKKKKTKKERKE